LLGYRKYDALGLQMTTLADVSDMLKEVRRETSLSQHELARRAGVARTTVARMETLAKNDMSVSVLVRLLEAAGYDLKVVAHGHGRTLEDILAEQRATSGPNQ
jgi:transcriptional regulator with XRE-family HTH domain